MLEPFAIGCHSVHMITIGCNICSSGILVIGISIGVFSQLDIGLLSVIIGKILFTSRGGLLRGRCDGLVLLLINSDTRNLLCSFLHLQVF
jgi:hypothetical protein